jgi:hypothetical protein
MRRLSMSGVGRDVINLQHIVSCEDDPQELVVRLSTGREWRCISDERGPLILGREAREDDLFEADRERFDALVARYENRSGLLLSAYTTRQNARGKALAPTSVSPQGEEEG